MFLSLRWLAGLSLVLLGFVAAQPHPLTGTYAYRENWINQRVDIHVAADGSVTGTYGALFGATYFEGSLDGNVAAGKLYEIFTLITHDFRFEFNQDVLTSFVNMAGSGVPEPSYLLRQPGPGPTEAIPAPIEVLLHERRRDAVVATSESGVAFRLIDALHYVDLVSHIMNEGGLEGYAFTGRYLAPMVSHVVGVFRSASADVQLMLADSGSWWRQIQTGWRDAPQDARDRIMADTVLLTFGAEDLADLHADPTFAKGGSESCPDLAGCLVAVVSLEEIRLARQRSPCFYLDGCEPASSHRTGPAVCPTSGAVINRPVRALSGRACRHIAPHVLRHCR